ncbi:chlorogenic acid esterase precursor [Fusarium austroafricanum]|uniref:Chlorogenic acid esterase n=1 Tax=Fusarium austroafricanum TaxID=2364996 RepID=A0A8H4KKD4_9HYPO|nr:chlorogenic acid esterase precursor [Fusarium austroafricanum]
MKLIILLFLVIASYAATCEAYNAKNDDLTIRTDTGTFTGLIDPKFPHTRQWRSIPFAEPPVASRRWLPPQKLPQNPDQHRYSAKFPPSCPQFVSAVESYWNLPLTKGNLIYNGAQNDTSGLVGEATSEDCLHLAIWRPTSEAPEGGFPVAFFMTGGGFVQGGVDLPWQNPESWVERSQSHIVVSVNYRVGIFGFPNARGLANGERNLGILDQRAALEWVHENIAAFGGNPKRIMQWGRSAGGMSADIHAYAWHEDPIAESYYMESGEVFSISSVLQVRDSTYSNFSFVARHIGCGSPCGKDCEDEDGKAELDCMRQVSMAQIVNFVGQYGDQGESPPLTFSLTVDDVIYFSNYKARAESGKIANRPVMLSMTSNEFSALLPWPPENLTEGYNQTKVDAGTIPFAVCSLLNSTTYRNRLGIPVFRFQYAAEFPNLNYYKWLGAYHNAETPLIFGTYGLLDHVANTTEFQVEMSHSMQDHIVAFLEDPYNGPQKLGWGPMVTSDPDGGYLLRFGGSSGKVVERVDGVDVDGVCLGVGGYDAFP